MAQPNKMNPKDVEKLEESLISSCYNLPYLTTSFTWTTVNCDKKQTIPTNTLPHVKQIIFSNPMTTVIWADDTKTQVECKHGDVFDESVGFALCVSKRLYGRELYSRLMKRAKRQR